MNFIFLSNCRINKNNIEFEFLYKSDKELNKSVFYLTDEKQRKYKCNSSPAPNKVIYSYHNNQGCYITKICINLPLLAYGKLKMVCIQGEEEINLEIRDNKGKIITEKENPYIIFAHQYKIIISKNNIEINEKRRIDSLKYEFKKQIYGIKKYHKLFLFRFLKLKKRKYYLFNDRLLYGDDNAEQLFKNINKNHPQLAKNCYFVLDKKSNSFKRIKKEGKVLKYGSFRHKFKFLNSRMVISSHASYLSNCFNPFHEDEMDLYKDIIQKKFVFVQHGVIMNDVREYLNRELITADLFITSTKSEYNYICSEDFMYFSEMVVGTGLPRFDRLTNNKSKPIILISPTWRVLKENEEFKDSNYYKVFKNLLQNKKIKELLDKNNYKIKFLLHPVFAQYKSLFEELANDKIEILESSKIKYFELFNECSIFITDYSSIHYDVAFLKKPIIYYQFDQKYFFENHYKSGYFNYEKDGFGSVVKTENYLIDELEYYIKNNCKIKKEYENKINNTFIYTDHQNSERVFKEICKIDKKDEKDYRFNNVH